MTRTMYDAVAWENIPADAEMVAGYIDGPRSQWPAQAWDRFPHAVKVKITVDPADNAGDVLDVETGDARPSDAPGWIRRRLAAGARFVTIYCNRSTLPAVVSACGGLAFYRWIATLDGTRDIPGAAAVQYQGGVTAGYDMSVVHDDAWHPSPGPAPKPAPQPSVPHGDLGGSWQGPICAGQWPGASVIAGIASGHVYVKRQETGQSWAAAQQVSQGPAKAVSLVVGPGDQGELFYVAADTGHLIQMTTSDRGASWA